MIQETYNDLYDSELAKDAIIHDCHPGFKEDYICLQILLKKYKPKTFFEIGCCAGDGTKIIKHTLGKDTVVFSLDLPTEQIHSSLRVGKGDRVGKGCDLPFVLLRGDSMTFDFSKYPCEGYFIDGNHTEENVYHETLEVLRYEPIIVILHDTDIPEVMRGLQRAYTDAANGNDYNLIRVVDTRISYLLKVDA